MPLQQETSRQARQQAASPANEKKTDAKMNKQSKIPEHDMKQNSGISASMALQGMQKAWDLRQAANAVGDPNARQEILAKAINKEIEAESFGKAAKYTQSGAFQGLAAGAGLGVQPGVTLGKLTGALVGGLVSTVTGLLGGGVGSVYGAMNGPFWDLGDMASQGVRNIVGDFPNWTATPAQKKALEKMVIQTRETQAPSKEELERMKADAPDDMPQSWTQNMKDITSWKPSMPSAPAMPSKSALGLGGLSSVGKWGTSVPWGSQGEDGDRSQAKQQQPRLPKQRLRSQDESVTQAQNQQMVSTSGQQSNQDNEDNTTSKKKVPPRGKAEPGTSTVTKEYSDNKERSTDKTTHKKVSVPDQEESAIGESIDENGPGSHGHLRSSRSSQTKKRPEKKAASSETRANSFQKTSKAKSGSGSGQPDQKTLEVKQKDESLVPREEQRRKPRKLGPRSSKAQSIAHSSNTSNDSNTKTNEEDHNRKRAPRKLASKSSEAQVDQAPERKRTPRKLASR